MADAQPDDDAALRAVAAYIAREQLLAPGQPVLAAVSGGGDSLALLHLLHRLGHPVTLAHANHGRRGPESDADQAFVEAAAAALGRPCIARTIALDGPGSFEMRARRARHAFLLAAAAEAGIEAIALGHTLEDQAETVLLRLLRGAGTDGLGGIAPKRRAQGHTLVRPLLECRRDDLRRWLDAQGLAWREDGTNADPTHLRNRLRHEAMPLLRTFNPRLDEALGRYARLLDGDRAWLAELTREAAGGVLRGNAIDREAFAALPPALQRRLLRRFAWRLGTAPDAARTEAAVAFVGRAETGQRLDLGDGVQLVQGRDQTLADHWGPQPPEAPITVPGAADFGPWRIAVSLQDATAEDPRTLCTPWRQVLDADRIGTALTVRGPRQGDRFRPLGLGGTKKLYEYLQDRGVPAPARPHVPLLCDGPDILWVGGHSPAARAAVTGDTTRWAVCELREREDDAIERETGT